jgi:FSR family fosmidomycin resistance protein-like MFS transporter
MQAREKRILTAVSIFHAFNDASVVALPTIFPLLYPTLIKRYADIGTLIVIGLSVSFLLQFVVGHMAKGRHYRTLLAVDNFIVGAFLLLTPLARSYPMLVFFYAGVRLGSSIYHPVGVAWVTHSFKGGKLDRALGIQSGFGDLGVLLAFLGTGYLAQGFGWAVPLLVWGAFDIVAGVAGLWVSRGTTDADGFDGVADQVSWKETIRDQSHLLLPALLGGLGWGITLAYAPNLLNHKLGASMSVTGICLGGWIGAGASAGLLYGRAAELLGRYGTIVWGCIATAAITCFIGFSRNLVATGILLTLFGGSLLLTFPAVLSLIGSATKSKNRTAAFSLNSNIQVGGNAIFTFAAGFMSDAWGINTPFFLVGAMSLIVAVYVVALRNRFRAVPEGASPAEAPSELLP